MPDIRDVTVKFRIGDDVIDIPSMLESSAEEYRDYIEPYLFFVDHHDVLRATQGEYPIAATADQVDILINYLQQVKKQMSK